MAQIEHRARLYGLPPLRWPDPWPGNYLAAMRAAIFAQRAGRGREFTRSAFRAAFQQGLDLSEPEHVLELAGQVDLDPAQMRAALQDPIIKLGLRNATDAAHQSGVFGVPSILAAGELFWGDDRLREAAIRLGRA
jgi:2-hydroxychromene-2-carboxylate isomerase